MNIAIVFAGGTGKRMKFIDKPKQFLEVKKKPILVYTLEKFQKNTNIDAVILVVLENWIEHCKKLKKQYNLTKLIDIVQGGMSGYDSIYNGLLAAKKYNDGDAVVLIHDGVRPLVDNQTIDKAIECTRNKGNAITVSPAIETVITKGNDGLVENLIDRSICLYARAPQCFYLKDILKAHDKARQEGIHDFIDSASLMKHYGYSLYTIEGCPENIKITTQSDFYMFRAFLEREEIE